MRIGIVVPAEIIDEIITFLSGEFPEIEAVPFPYHSIVEIPDLLSGRQNSVETFLFLGDTARRYAEKAVPHVTEWLTIPRSSASLLRLFYRARDKGYPMRIATDLDRRDFFDLAFKEIGMSENDFSLEILPILAYNEGLLIKNAAAMEKLYRMGKVSYCITLFYKVRDILDSKGIPVYILQPSFDDIRNGLQRLVLTHESMLDRGNRLAVIAIHIDALKESIPNNNDYRLSMEKLQVSREIHRFAHFLDAACIEQPPSGYFLFTTPALIENATNHYHHFSLLSNVAETTAFTLSIGIGYGETAAEAKYNALQGMEHSSASGGNRAYIIGKELFSRVPMSKNGQASQEKKEHPIDEQFLYLSKKSGVSVRIIADLYHACRDTGRQRFTASELADLTSVTPRTINRILAKLNDHHLAQDVGRRFTDKTGRPSRIIEIQFESKKHDKNKK